MTEITREEKLKLIEKLPQKLQDFLYSEDTGAFLLYLGNKYKLPNEKISLLSKIVGDIILGITQITSLAQEINSKITTDPQIAMNLAQELYNDLLAPVMKSVSAPTLPAITTAPKPTAPIAPQNQPILPSPIPTPLPTQPPTPKTDQYREPKSSMPEIIDLRKTPPAVSKVELPPLTQMPVAAAPIPPMPAPSISPKTLTFTKPIEPPKPVPLIEADPHKTTEIADLSRPQYIIRPPGLAPTDLPHDVLDLRKDKGEF